jgi:hypothetical protein
MLTASAGVSLVSTASDGVSDIRLLHLVSTFCFYLFLLPVEKYWRRGRCRPGSATITPGLPKLVLSTVSRVGCTLTVFPICS